jgi:glutamate decarboxylase
VGELLAPQDLERALELRLPDGDGYGEDGLQDVIGKILKYSVNTWDPGFMDKLYASTDPVGVASDLLLTALNTNVWTPSSVPYHF